ncbi:MAG: asparagine synthase (glutamine-hydrolyzing) [Candidatus Hydrogenedentes bacterium]|nr:asparagine synthase (glutamine-hydrolyzing) [Candidatus Hydrogenedentota bacterium]
MTRWTIDCEHVASRELKFYGGTMCGIAGITGRWPDLVKTMGERLAHRGPDGAGVFVDDNVSMAHRRLAVLDPTDRGAQPMAFRDMTIVYNGELYNFREIRSELESSGDSFVSDTDTEVALHAYARWGTDCLAKFNGMFALAIYDRSRNLLFIARDRLGIKPLYYSKIKGHLVFASEIKSFLPELDSTPLDPNALVDYFTYRFVPDEKTVVDGVYRLPPGCFMNVRLDTNQFDIHRYWRIEYEPNGLSFDENAERVRDMLRDSVRHRLIADVPLGVYLSGGLDSSAIVAFMAETADRPVDTYTVTFGDSRLSESGYARRIADRFGTRHHEINVEMNAVDILPQVVRYLDEPVGDAATIPLYLMARETKKHVTVVLSGEGSDELFAGYDKYKYLYYSRFLPSVPDVTRSGLMGRVNGLFDPNEAKKYLRFAAVFDDSEMNRIMKVPVRSGRRFDLEQYFSTGNRLNNLLNLDMATWLPNDLFLKADKMTMAHAVETRVPFMDHELVEFAATIPPDQKMVWGTGKSVYRRAVKSVLPHETVRRRKQGFTIPLGRWLDAGLRDYALDIVRSTDIPELNMDEVEQTVRYTHKNVYTRRKFWTTLFFVAWYRETIGV